VVVAAARCGSTFIPHTGSIAVAEGAGGFCKIGNNGGLAMERFLLDAHVALANHDSGGFSRTRKKIMAATGRFP